MEITVKRRTWFLGWLMPISIKFNSTTIGSVGGFHTRTMEIPEESGTLTYDQPLDKTDVIEVTDGDVVLVKETVLSKLINIVFLITMLAAVFFNANTLVTGEVYDSLFPASVGTILIAILIILLIISFFSNSYQLVKDNHSPRK